MLTLLGNNWHHNSDIVRFFPDCLGKYPYIHPFVRATHLQGFKSDDCLFWDRYLCIIFDAYTSISSTCINEIKCLSIIVICIIFVIFNLHPPNIQFFQGHVSPATKCRRAADRDISDLFGNSRPACGEAQNYVPWELFETRCCLYSK
jgi:hypothetical protein